MDLGIGNELFLGHSFQCSMGEDDQTFIIACITVCEFTNSGMQYRNHNHNWHEFCGLLAAGKD